MEQIDPDSAEMIQVIVERSGLSEVQAATIAAQMREAELAELRAAEGRDATSTEWVRPIASVPATSSSRRSCGLPASVRARLVRPTPEPPCPFCNGAGYTLEDLPYWHPRFGVLTACVCKLDEIAAKDARILRDLADELQRYRHQSRKPCVRCCVACG